MPVISIALDEELLRKLDMLVKVEGFSSRSEAVREAVKNLISECELVKMKTGRMMASITVMYGYEERRVDQQLARIRHEYDELVTGNIHLHLGKLYCVEVFVVEGEVERVHEFITRLRGVKGLLQLRYTLLPVSSGLQAT